MPEQPWTDILAVDDAPANLKALVGMLTPHGYRVRPVTSGEAALRVARMQPPDLILLDVSMPGMDGYAVCRALKADPDLAAIPVIFLSAHSEPLDKVQALDCGGVDYITKPFTLEEVRARVALHLRLRRQQAELQASHDKLHELEALRDELAHMLIHDLRSPLSAVLMSLDLVRADAASLLPAESLADIEAASRAARRMVNTVTAVLDVRKLEAERMTLRRSNVDVGAIVREVIASQRALAGERTVVLEADGADGAIVHVDRDLVFRVVENLLDNALKFTPPGERVVVRVAVVGELRVEVEDGGPGVPEADRNRVFEKFGQLGTKSHSKFGSSGFGLPFCKLAVEAHGGTIGVRCAPGGGSCFWFAIPVEGQPCALVTRPGG